MSTTMTVVLKIYALLQKTADSLEGLISLQESIREAERMVAIQKAQSGTKITLYKNYLESLIVTGVVKVVINLRNKHNYKNGKSNYYVCKCSDVLLAIVIHSDTYE